MASVAVETRRPLGAGMGRQSEFNAGTAVLQSVYCPLAGMLLSARDRAVQETVPSADDNHVPE